MKNFPALSSATSVQATTFPPEQLRALKQENRQLRQEVEKLREAAANPSSSANSALNLSDENIPAMTRSNTNTSSTSVVDPNKLNQRLKEIFKEKINTLRHGIYLLTGYQVSRQSWLIWLLSSFWLGGVILHGDSPKIQIKECLCRECWRLPPLSGENHITSYRSVVEILTSILWE